MSHERNDIKYISDKTYILDKYWPVKFAQIWKKNDIRWIKYDSIVIDLIRPTLDEKSLDKIWALTIRKRGKKTPDVSNHKKYPRPLLLLYVTFGIVVNLRAFIYRGKKPKYFMGCWSVQKLYINPCWRFESCKTYLVYLNEETWINTTSEQGYLKLYRVHPQDFISRYPKVANYCLYVLTLHIPDKNLVIKIFNDVTPTLVAYEWSIDKVYFH